MDDVRIMPGPGIPRGATIAGAELVERFSHASGPGGQGVNTTDSRVQLTFDIGASPAFTEYQRSLLLHRLSGKLVDNTITITAAEHRSQRRNRAAARERLAALLRDALAPEAPRRATRPTRGSQLRRSAAKRARSQTKENRRRPADE